MWTLNTLSKEAEYPDIIVNTSQKKINLKSYINKGIDTAHCSSTTKKYLKANLQTLLIGKPEQLYLMVDEIILKLFKNSNNYKNWTKAKKKKGKKTKSEKNILSKYQYIEKIFNYDKLMQIIPIKKNGIEESVAYTIANIIGVNTCVYCNRQYIFTVAQQKTRKGITKPQFDHYLPKSRYPFFALSLYNLIPSCSICNLLKRDKDIDEIECAKNYGNIKMNPYMNKKEELFKFTYIPNGQGYPERVEMRALSKVYKEKIKRFLKVFELEEIYSTHKDYELKDLYLFATKYSDTYVANMLEQVGLNLRISQEEAYRILFGTEYDDKRYNDRPLSKLKKDILEELGVI